MDMVIQGISWSVEQCGLNADFVGALPTAIMKPARMKQRMMPRRIIFEARVVTVFIVSLSICPNPQMMMRNISIILY